MMGVCDHYCQESYNHLYYLQNISDCILWKEHNDAHPNQNLLLVKSNKLIMTYKYLYINIYWICMSPRLRSTQSFLVDGFVIYIYPNSKTSSFMYTYQDPLKTKSKNQNIVLYSSRGCHLLLVYHASRYLKSR